MTAGDTSYPTLTITAVATAMLAPLADHGVPSGIDKRPAAGRIAILHAGLAGDAQGDTRHHGGPEKAVHHYPRDHYAAWQAELGELPILSAPAAFGENLSLTGLVETDIAIGDLFRAGTALLQVSQGRQPCWRLNARFGVPDMARRVQDSGRTGWYYRVIEEGILAPGDTLRLVDRPAAAWTIARLCRILYADPLNMSELQAVTALPLLAEGWRSLAARRIATGQVEDWSRRLESPQ
jgi:MOSC domain-containing protein YiiM